MATSAYQRERRRLAESLKNLRAGAGFSGARLSQLLGWPQSKVSKIETLKQVPTDDDVTAWASATGASQEATAELLVRLRDARVEYAAWKDAFQAVGVAGAQAELASLESASTRIAEFQPALIPGLLQTPDYAREFLHLPCGPLSFGRDENDLEQMIANRIQRQQVLYQHDKRVQVVLLEAALRTQLVSPATLAGQLDRLGAIAGLSNVELGIIPFEAPVPVFPLSGFRLYDSLVIVESIVGEQQLADTDDVERFENYLALLLEAASKADDAQAVIRRSLAAVKRVPDTKDAVRQGHATGPEERGTPLPQRDHMRRLRYGRKRVRMSAAVLPGPRIE